MKRYLALSLVTGFLFACGNPTAGLIFFINVGILNSTTVTLNVEIGNGGEVTPLVAPPGYTTTEIPGDTRDQVSFSGVGPGGLEGDGFCTATPHIVSTPTYGVVNLFVEPGTTSITVECFSEWLESPEEE